MADFVPAGFVAPVALDDTRFRLRPLGPEHNAADYAAWTSSMDHIRATPGFEDWGWPQPMTLDENRRDLERHASDFVDRTGFTYTVLAPADDTVIGCVYIYPGNDADHDASVRLLGPRCGRGPGSGARRAVGSGWTSPGRSGGWPTPRGLELVTALPGRQLQSITPHESAARGQRSTAAPRLR